MGSMSRPASVLSGLTLLLSCSLSLAQSPEASLSTLIDEYEQLIRKDDPVSAGQEGDREALRRLPDVPVRETNRFMAALFVSRPPIPTNATLSPYFCAAFATAGPSAWRVVVAAPER